MYARRVGQTAIIFENDEGGSEHITYLKLHQEVCRVANVLKAWGVRKGDTVAVYLPMIPELGACTAVVVPLCRLRDCRGCVAVS